MITNLLKKGLQSYNSIPMISSMQNSQNQKQAANTSIGNVEMQRIVEQILINLSTVLSERLGQKTDPSEFRDLATDVLKTKVMQNSLIETKQRYNDLVNRSTTLYQQARKISNSVGQFVTSINLYLQSQQLLVPLKEIQKGINELLPEKVEKQMNYLIRIFQTNFQAVIEKKIKIAESNLHEEIKLQKNLNKNLQAEIISLKGTKNNEQSKYFQQTMKISNINEKITKLSSEKNEIQRQWKEEIINVKDKEKIITEHQKQINRLKLREGELLQKIKNVEIKNHRLERQIKEKNSSSQQLNAIVQKLKVKQEQIVQQLEAEYKKKQSNHESLRKKIYLQKSLIQQKLSSLSERHVTLEQLLLKKNEQIKKLHEENQKLKQNKYVDIEIEETSQNVTKNQTTNSEQVGQNQPDNSNKKKQRISLTELAGKVKDLQEKKKDLQAKLGKQSDLSVNKEVLKTLFLNYDDQSKEWTIRRNIKFQIYSLLDLKDRIPKTQEAKTSKWFGIF